LTTAPTEGMSSIGGGIDPNIQEVVAKMLPKRLCILKSSTVSDEESRVCNAMYQRFVAQYIHSVIDRYLSEYISFCDSRYMHPTQYCMHRI
jgi:hypothetical protein